MITITFFHGRSSFCSYWQGIIFWNKQLYNHPYRVQEICLLTEATAHEIMVVLRILELCCQIKKFLRPCQKREKKKILIKVFELQDFRSKVQSSESMRNSIQQLGLPQISRHSCRNLLWKLNWLWTGKYQLSNSSSEIFPAMKLVLHAWEYKNWKQVYF